MSGFRPSYPEAWSDTEWSSALGPWCWASSAGYPRGCYSSQKSFGFDLLFFFWATPCSREPSPFRSWPIGFDPYRKYNSSPACAVSEPQSANGDIRLIDVHKNTGTVPICALTRSADPRGVAYRPCTFAWGKSCLGLCPRHEDLALSSGALFLRTNNNTHASSSFLRIVSPSGYQMMCRKPLPSIQGSEGLGCSRRNKVQTKRNFDE